MKKICYAVFALVMFASCDDMFQGDGDLSSSDIVKGLKTALTVGTDSSTAILSASNGYYGDALVRIPLPDEAMSIIEKTEYIRKYSKSAADVIDSKMDDLILAINHSAEEAAKDAAPIFSTAITNLSIVDGLRILNGEVPNGDSELKSSTGFDSLAATTYLKMQTYDALVSAYAPKMDQALEKKIAGNASAVSLWNDITSNYNGFVKQYGKAARVAAQVVGKDIAFNEVNTDIGEFVTQKALDGLFLKVGDQEKAIRKNPFQWASDILRKVFGSVYEAVTK